MFVCIKTGRQKLVSPAALIIKICLVQAFTIFFTYVNQRTGITRYSRRQDMSKGAGNPEYLALQQYINPISFASKSDISGYLEDKGSRI